MSVKDLISAAFNKDANSFESTLHAIMQEKMSAAIQARFSPAVYEEEVDLDEAKDDSEDDESTEEDDDEEDMKEEAEELGEAEVKYVIKHKKTKQVLNTHDDYATAKDEHEGLGDEKSEYGVYKQTKKDAALRNRNTYREEAEQIDELSDDKLRDYHAKAGADRKKAKAEVEKGMAAKKFTPASVQKTSDSYKRFIKRGKGMTAAANKMSE